MARDKTTAQKQLEPEGDSLRLKERSPARTYFPDFGQYHRPRGLNGRVRNGIGCDPAGMGTGQNEGTGVLPVECRERITAPRHVPMKGRTFGRTMWQSFVVSRRPARAGDDHGTTLLPSGARRLRRRRESGQADRPISTGPLSALRHVHARPITLWSSRGLIGRTRFGVGFTLICFQRFSFPDIATRRCR
jgi:hypothetical protein